MKEGIGMIIGIIIAGIMMFCMAYDEETGDNIDDGGDW
jgi:hypothetical protein